MSKPLPRSSFNSPQLVRLLANLSTGDAAGSKSFAERLGQWLNLTDAIALSSALGSGPGSAGAPARADAAVADEVAELARVRTALADSIRADGLSGTARARIKLPAPESAADPVTGYTPYHRYYLAHQRDMEAAISALRARVRQALAANSAHSPALGQLAALDAVLEKALGERERNLLATVPELLARRFEALRAAHRQAPDEASADASDDPQRWMQPGGWLAAFCRDLQAVLLAELEVRLQPVAGLVEAFDSARPLEAATPFRPPFPPPEEVTETGGSPSQSFSREVASP